MSEYFSDKDQSFEMPNDDPSEANMGNINPSTQKMPDESGFGPTQDNTNEQHQDLVYMGTMALIIAVMLYILYAMFFSGSSAPKNAVIEPIKVEAPVNQAKDDKPVTPSPAPVAAVQPAPEVRTTSMSVASEKLASQPSTMADNQQKINEMLQESQYLTNMVRKIQDEKEEISQRFEDLEREVDGLVATNKDAEERIKRLEQKMAEKEPKKTMPEKAVTYRLQAVVEGRAWIESSAGKNRTVKVGDIIKDYGVVTHIDVVNSIVSTSSGKAIKVN